MANPNSSVHKYIPAGCLRANEADGNFPAEFSSAEGCGQWKAFLHPGNPSAVAELFPGSQLPPDLQELLLHSFALKPFARLFHCRWVQFEFLVCSASCGIYRVYVLPDDVDRRSIPRSDRKLRKDLQALLSQLDYSREIWYGDYTASRSPLHSAQDGSMDEEEVSLLQMFNTIPSPNPQPGSIQDPDYQKAMDDLLISKIEGINTPLYRYQTRSAALMLQREVQPGQVIDPRLQHVLDQHENPWYYDKVVGTVLREPRYYDGISGGILAEEMGAGKTLICLAVILATRHFPAETPDIHRSDYVTTRPSIGSLADMAAATLTRDAVPWSLPKYLGPSPSGGLEYTKCIEALQRNPGWYLLPRLESRRESRHSDVELAPPDKIFLSHCSLVIVPPNLVKQWEQEIRKHTSGLKVLVLTAKKNIPGTFELLTYDMVLFSTTRFEKLKQDRSPTRTGWNLDSPLATIHFKRVIVDEGHKLGNSKIGKKSDILLILEHLKASARWIVTGTPSTGLFGVDDSIPTTPVSEMSSADEAFSTPSKLAESSGQQERKDLERIGAIASLYLKARPWANTSHENGDTLAEWDIYVMQPKHSSKSNGRKDSLRRTLDSVIIRHRRSEVGDLLPPVDEKVILLDGSYQDKLCLNLFSMMIIFNAVQSQKTDQDYFFHHSQRTALLQLVHNIRQSSFFGGYFFSVDDIFKAIETGEKFLLEKKIPISEDDERVLRDALAFGHVAIKNRLKDLAQRFHEVPFYVNNFPGGGKFSRAWALDGEEEEMVCTDAPMMRALQQFLRPCIDSPHSLLVMFNDGRFVEKGKEEREKALEQRMPAAPQAAPYGAQSSTKRPPTLAGNTKLGEDNTLPMKHRSGSLGTPARMDKIPAPNDVPATEIAEPLAKAKIVSTASVKLSYLIDSIVKYQGDEQIIVFYENDNAAFYLAEHLEILQIHHLIYAKGITAERRAQYVDTFNNNPKFRVLLMDISQAAFGLDMRSASRIYFINPVLNPQVEAQAIGRVRRISQKKQVSVETLVLKGSLEEVIMERRQKMTQAEHRKCKSILDDRPIYEWILNAKILPLPEGDVDGPDQMAPLKTPQFLFGRGFGRVEHPDADLVMGDLSPTGNSSMAGAVSLSNSVKRSHGHGGQNGSTSTAGTKPKRLKVRVQFAATPEEE